MTEKIKLTTRGRYAVMAMVEIGQAKGNQPVPLADIAIRANISLSYLEQLVAGLRRHELVKSYRGPGGGYVLAKPLEQVAIADILMAAEDSTPAKRNNINNRSNNCEYTSDLWDHIGKILYNQLRSLSLGDLIQKRFSI